MSLASILKQFDLYTATKDTGVKFWRQLQQQHKALDNIGADDLRKTLQVFKKQLSREDFPGQESEASDVSQDVFKEIIQRINKLDPNELSANGTDKFYSDGFDFVIDMFELGPGTTHLRMVETLRGYCHGYRRYYHNISVDRLRPLFKTLAREFKSKEPNFHYSKKSYLHPVILACHAVMDKKPHPQALPPPRALPKVMQTVAQEEFLDLYMFHYTSFLSRHDDVIEIQRYMSQMIWSQYEGGPFHGIRKREVFRRHLQRLSDVIKQKDFPKSEKTLKIVQDVLEGLLSGIIYGNLVSDLVQDVLKFLVAVCLVKKSQHIQNVIETVGKFYSSIQNAKIVAALKGNSGLFETITPTLTNVLDSRKDRVFFDVTLVKPAVCNVISVCMNKFMISSSHVQCSKYYGTKEHLGLMMTLLKSLVKIPHSQCIDTAQAVLVDKEKFLKWKPHLEDAKEKLDIISKGEITQDPDNNKKTLTHFYLRFLSNFLDQTKRDRVIKDLNERMVKYCLKCLQSRSHYMFQLGSEVMDRVEFNIKEEKDRMYHALKTLHPLLKDENFPWTLQTARNIAQSLSAQAMDAILDAKVLTDDELQSLVRLTEMVTGREFIHADTNTPDTIFYSLYTTVGTRVVKMRYEKHTRKHNP